MYNTNIDLFFPENKDNYINLIEKGLVYCPELIRKKILICSTEIIQNNIIHNKNRFTNSYFSINFTRINNKFYTNYTQILEKKTAKILIEKIDLVNSKSLEELKEIYENNILEENNNSAGNGLITCKLKSKNSIIHTGIEEVEVQNINSVFFNITLTFKL